jgi:hypothetical protein
MSTTVPPTYPDADYEAAHRATFERAPRHPIAQVLPPGVRKADFARALDEFVAAVGRDAVFVGDALADYIDPYDVHEADESRRRVPSAAVWCVAPSRHGPFLNFCMDGRLC